MNENTRNRKRYNVVPLDEEKLRADSYTLRTYTSASETNPRDKFFRYEANRNDTNLFQSGTYNETRTQVHDAVYTEFKKNDINVVEINDSNNSLSIVQGYNTDEQKNYGYVFEKIKKDPTKTVNFTEHPSMDLVSKPGLYIRNIKIYGSNIGIKNSYMPATIISPSDFKGYRSELSSSGVTSSYDITKIHHEGDIRASLQSPFTNQHVGGYLHRHQPINTGSDNSNNRFEMLSISASGSTIVFKSPLGTTPDYSKLAIRYSRDGGAKRIVNTKRIKTTDPRIAGNYSKNYEVFNAANRNENNLWLRDNPTASFAVIDSPYVSGTQDSEVQDFKLENGVNNETIITQRFGAPGGPESSAPIRQDPTSRQFSPYNTVNYRNSTIRYYLNKQFLVNHADYAGYTTAGYGLTASFHNIQRNGTYYTGSSGIYKKYDNPFVRREIPSSPRGYSWIKTRSGTSSFDNNIFVKDYNDPGIIFLSKSIDRDVYFEFINFNSNHENVMSNINYGIYRPGNFTYNLNFTASNYLSLNTFLNSRNKLMGYSTQRQLSNYYNTIRLKARRGIPSYDSFINTDITPAVETTIGNYVGDTDENKNFKYFNHPPINSKYENMMVEYEMQNGVKEKISLPFLSNYAYLGDYYNDTDSKLDNLYKDSRNPRYADKKNSLLSKILFIDNEKRKNQIEYPKINKIIHREKLWPKVANTYLRRSRDRSYLDQSIFWHNNIDLRREIGLYGYAQLPYGSKTNWQFTWTPANGYPSSYYFSSYWPLDTFTSASASGDFLERSGRMMQLDNVQFISSSYSSVGYVSHLPPSGVFTGWLNFGRNHNTNRPQNVIFEQAGKYPYDEEYLTIDYDTRYEFKNYSTISSYNPNIVLNKYFLLGSTVPPSSYEEDPVYNRITNNTSFLYRKEETTNFANITLNQAGLENNIYSDFIDILPDFNKNEDLKISKIKFNLNTVKKFFQFSSAGLIYQSNLYGLCLYPSERLAYSVALNFYTYYIDSTNTQPNPPASKGFTIVGSLTSPSSQYNLTKQWFKPALSTFLMPGIICNSIKAGVGMPFSAVTTLPAISGNTNPITGNINGTYYTKIPFEAALDPSKIAGITIYDADPDLKTYNNFNTGSTAFTTSSATLSTGFKNDLPYKDTINNYFAEIVNFFIKDGKLPKLKSKPQKDWYFADLNKVYSMKLMIFKSSNFDTYTSKESYGPRPYIYHNPPWMTFSGEATLNSVTASTFNSDTLLAPSASYKNSSYAIATITFDPRQLTASTQIVAGKGAQFTFNEIKRYSTVTFENYFVTSSAVAQNAVNLGDCVEIFGFTDKDETWTPYIKWVCPTANLNFYNTSAKLTQSNSNDSGGTTAGDAIRGIWHQLGNDVDENTGLFFQVLDNSNSVTGSLLEVVGFNPKDRVRIGEVASSKTIEEGIIILPVYIENGTEEKLFELNIEKFEKNYLTSEYIKSANEFSKKFVLPPLLDFMKIRRKSNKPLAKKEYGNVSSPILMFFTEFKSSISRSDLLKIWQGLPPTSNKNMEIDDKIIEFDLKNNDIFSYDDLVKFDGTLPQNIRFKIFKVFKRAITNYQDIIDATLERETEKDYKLTTNWPYSTFEFVNRAEVKIELEYDKTFNVPKGSYLDEEGKIIKDIEKK